MLIQKVRKAGNSYVVTIPKEEMERQNLREGDMVSLEVRKVDYQVQLAPDVLAALQRSLDSYKDDYDYLGTH